MQGKNMLDFLYILIIYPITFFIELCFLFVHRVFNNSGYAILGVSIAFSVITLPLYFMAEKFQRKERELQNAFRPKINRIKAAFKGDEQYMILSTYYKQNNYHPIYTLRNSFGLLIQIPFFIAAYTYLSHLQMLKGTSFLFINNLGAPDGLLSLGNKSFNILPILMTIVNIISGAVYTKGLEIKDKIQLYGMSIVFLVLLYNSPAGLVLYWTMNNIFSLGKNILQKTRHAKMIIFGILCFLAFSLDFYVIFLHNGYWIKRVIFCFFVSIVFFVPLFIKLFGKYKQKIYTALVLKDTSFWQDRTFIFSSLILFLLAGLVIPSSLIASSVLEFSFIQSYSSPLPFIMYSAVQAAGFFIFWPFCIYFMFSKKVKICLTMFIMILSGIAMIDTFLVPENFGFLTNTFIFSDPKPIYDHYNIIILNIAGIIFLLAILFFLFFSKLKKIVYSIILIIFFSLTSFTIYNTGAITKEFLRLQKLNLLEATNNENVSPVYTFSQTGQNVLFIMIDTTASGFLPVIFDEKPELFSIFSGFTWYPNCASFANHTLAGAPPLYGGYEYSPREINKRNNDTMFDKHKEAFLLLPVLFSNAGYSTTVTDPPFDNYQRSNLSIYSDFPKIHPRNIKGAYTTYWGMKHPDVRGLLIPDILKNTLIRFSFFKMSPLVLRLFIYDRGAWLTTTNTNIQSKINGGLTTDTIDDYALLDLLPDLTNIEYNQLNSFIMLYSHLPHAPAFLQMPDYLPVQSVTNRGTGYFANDSHYHVTMASFLLLGKYLTFLKENGVYDNTRIIIVADHGVGKVFPDRSQNIILPSSGRISGYNPLLLVKDFNSEGSLAIDNSFMTNADSPFFALEGIIEKPVNPFTHNPLRSDKAEGIYITTIGALSSYGHSKYQYKIGKNQWLYVKDNIFDSANWRAAKE
jgi:YidC/Oxa1 family membrane protein insertase